MRIENRIEIDAPVADVWAVTIDVEALPSITPTMTRVERLDTEPLEVGSMIRIKQPGQRERTWTVTEFDQHRRFTWSTRILGMTMTATHQITSLDDRTANTLEIELDGPMARVIGPLLKPSIRKALATENLGHKRAAESQAPRATQP